MKKLILIIAIVFSGMLMQAQGTPRDEMTPDQKYAINMDGNDTVSKGFAFMGILALVIFFIVMSVRRGSNSTGKITNVMAAGAEGLVRAIIMIVSFVVGIWILTMIGELLPENLRWIIVVIFIGVIVWIFQGGEWSDYNERQDYVRECQAREAVRSTRKDMEDYVKACEREEKWPCIRVGFLLRFGANTDYNELHNFITEYEQKQNKQKEEFRLKYSQKTTSISSTRGIIKNHLRDKPDNSEENITRVTAFKS